MPIISLQFQAGGFGSVVMGSGIARISMLEHFISYEPPALKNFRKAEHVFPGYKNPTQYEGLVPFWIVNLRIMGDLTGSDARECYYLLAADYKTASRNRPIFPRF